MLWLFFSLGRIYLDKLANGENEKYTSGDAVYSEEEVHEYFNTHKEELNQIAELITSKCKFRENGQLEVGISVFRYVEFFNRHRYIVRVYEYPLDIKKHRKETKQYESDFFTNDELEILNHLTDYYCDGFSIEPQYYGNESIRKIPHIRFVFRSNNFVTTQQLVYMPDGSEYKDSIGVVTNLEGNWYYQTTTLIE